MKKKGFTLVELLATIVILAIVSLIAIPLISNVIETSKKESAVVSAYGYIDALEKAVAINSIDKTKGVNLPANNELNMQNIHDALELDKLSIKGTKPDYVEAKFKKGKIYKMGLCINGYNIKYENGKADISNAKYCSYANIEKIDLSDSTNKMLKNNDDYNLVLSENDTHKINVSVSTKDNTVINISNDDLDYDNDIINVSIVNNEITINALKIGSTSLVIKAGIKHVIVSVNICNDSLLGYLQVREYKKTDEFQEEMQLNNEIYKAHVYSFEGNQTWDENMTFGTDDDIGAAGLYAQKMVIVKVNGDLTINSGVTVSPHFSAYGGPKGFLLYVTGKLTNDGVIDNSHGAYAEGQDVFLWKNDDNTYEFVPAVGASGGASAYSARSSNTNTQYGKAGGAATGRQTGGGGSGGSCYGWNHSSGAGGKGTSYSGGSGGGYADRDGNGSAGSSVGGAAGTRSSAAANKGAGNPGNGNGTGGLLIIYANHYINNNIVQAKGTSANDGGSSGGGSINIFYSDSNIVQGTTSANGGATKKTGGKGGNGSITFTELDLTV